MENEQQRKASDILLDLEAKIEALLGEIKSQGLTNKILSNKLNDIIARLDKQNAAPQKITVEAIQQPLPQISMPPGFNQLPAGDPERNIPYSVDSKIPETSSPQGFRRNSRPETYTGKEIKAPIQMPDISQIAQMPPAGKRPIAKPPPGRGPDAEIIAAQNASRQQVKSPDPEPIFTDVQPEPLATQGQVPVTQRCVDKNGKSIFLANVEILDMQTGEEIFKTRTNAVGKWSASVSAGKYQITVRKLESITKQKIESVQEIIIDGSQGRVELPMLIIK